MRQDSQQHNKFLIKNFQISNFDFKFQTSKITPFESRIKKSNSSINHKIKNMNLMSAQKNQNNNKNQITISRWLDKNYQDLLKDQKNLLLQKQKNSIEQIMEKINQIKENTQKKQVKNESESIQKREVSIIDFGVNFKKQKLHGIHITSNNTRHNTEPKQKKYTIIPNPKNKKQRCINFLIKEIDKQIKQTEIVEHAKNIYKNLTDNNQHNKLNIQKKIEKYCQVAKNNTMLEMTPPKSQQLHKNPPLKARRTYSSILQRKIDYKYEKPFTQKSKRHKFLKKGSHITGVVIQHLFKQKINDINSINFEKNKFVEKFNQVLPQDIEKKWQDQAQLSLKILKGNLSTRKQKQSMQKSNNQAEKTILKNSQMSPVKKTSSINESTKREFETPFDINKIIYLSDQKALPTSRSQRGI